MQVTEEILMRIGIDSRAVGTGLAKVSSLVKGWGASVVHHLQGAVGGFLGIAALEQGIEKIKEKILAIKNLSQATGFSTNFIQGVMNKLAEEGESAEKLERPLSNITALAGAKGQTAMQFLGDLAERYKSLNTQEERNLMLKQSGIKQWQALIPLLEEGRDGIEALNKGNFFTKIDKANISEFTQEWAGLAKVWSVFAATFTNVGGWFARVAGIPSRALGGLFGGNHLSAKEILSGFGSEEEQLKKISNLEALAARDKISLSEEENRLLSEGKQLLYQQLDLRRKLADQGKDSVTQLAEEYRKLTGAQKPENYIVTDRMKLAARIDDAETLAKLDWQRGKVNNPTESPHWSEARALRQSSNWLKGQDQDPTGGTSHQLSQISDKLNDLQHLVPIGKLAREIANEQR